MVARNIDSYTNGTTALQMPHWDECADTVVITPFPESRNAIQVVASGPIAGSRQRPAAKAKALKRILDSSEMYCSLRFESLLGCPYHAFTDRGVATLSAGAAFIAVLSLILGA